MKSGGVRWIINSPGVAGEIVGDEAIVINLEKGIYYSLRGVAADFWKASCGGARSEDALDFLAARYDADRATLEQAWEAFVAELRAEELVRSATAEDAPEPLEAAGPGAGPQVFERPRIEKFEDMRDMLLLDPIHEVSGQGWPNLPAEA